MLDYTAHMYSSQEYTSARRGEEKAGQKEAKGYAPHPPWLGLPDNANEPPCRHRQRDPEALLRPGDGGAGGVLPQTPEQKFRLIYLSAISTSSGVCMTTNWR